MEYVSIPWANHNDGNPNDYADLTVNLALWFVHILAGNAHAVNWSYPDLKKEALMTGRCTPSSASEDPEPGSNCEESEPTRKRRSSRPSSCAKKRKRNGGDNDDPHYSFSVSQSFSTQVCPFLLKNAASKIRSILMQPSQQTA